MGNFQPFAANQPKLSIALYGDDGTLGEATDYEEALSSGAFNVSTSSTSVTLAGPKTYTFPGAETWTCPLTFAQDLVNADSLLNFLYANKGKKARVTLTPQVGGQPWAADATLVPVNVGGAVAAPATSTATLPCLGPATPVEAPAGA